MTSPDLTAANIEKIAELFPNVITETVEGEGDDKIVKRAIDFDLLRQELSDCVVEGPRERYQLDWPGKREAAFAANAPIAKTLRPVRDESVDFDTTQNLFIEGDNLDALKLLQESYLGKVKLIYIDPPYNTGNDFVYSDDFATTNAEYLTRSGQVDDLGNRLIANTESNGRFHSDWLSMMFPRLKLARNLLAPDGMICVSIDDVEDSSLNQVGREVFGEANFVAQVIWKHTEQSKNDEPYFSRHHNYLVMFRRSPELPRFRLARKDADNSAYGNPDSDPRGAWRAGDVRSPNPRPSLRYDIPTPSGGVIPPPENGWRWSWETVQQKIEAGEIVFRDNETRILRKIYLADQEGRTPETVWTSVEAGTTREANGEIKELFGAAVFDTPKPTRLIRRLLELIDDLHAIVLDFFAGSSSTAHAVLAQNAVDGGRRRFIMVQLNEEPDGKSEAAKAGFSTIAALSRERIRLAGQKVLEDAGLTGDGLDIGFRALRVDTTNMADVLRTPDVTDQAQLAGLEDSVKPDRSGEDLLFQVLLDWGLELSMPISVEQIEGHEVFVVEDDALIACFDTEVSTELVRAIAKREPLRAVFRDSGFVSDDARINAEQIFREVSPSTDVKAL
jgi:adenine-specific DNA-methyltransferase